MNLTTKARRVRSAMKRFLYGGLYLRDAIGLMFARTKPLVRFTVEAEPPSVYLNFEIDPERRERLERELDLPHPLCPIRCIEGEEPFYALTLNVYRVSGLAVGIRAEWSVYVRDPGGTPRYMVVEALSEFGTVDPITLISRGTALGYARERDWLSIEYVPEGTTRFRARIRAPKDGSETVRAHPEWVEANDYIYWLNGLCDRTFYDSGMANPTMWWVDAGDYEIENATQWSRFIGPAPRHVIVYGNAIDFAISPWWNVDEMGGYAER